MKKLCAFLLLALMLLPAWAGADDYFVPDPEHFFGAEMVDPQGATYTMYFDEDPLDMFNAYVSLLQTDYDLKKLSISDYAHILTHEGVRDSGVTIEYLSDGDGYRIEICIHSLVAVEAREQYDPDWAEVEMTGDDGLVLLSPESFFDGKYTFFNVTNSDGYYYQWNWDTYSFTVEADVTEEEVEADAQRYCQALVDTGYFRRVEEASGDLAYTGDREAAVATSNGNVKDWQVHVNVTGGYSDVPYSIRVNLVEGFTFSDVAAPVKQEKKASAGANDAQEAAEPRTASEAGVIAWDDGRMIADPGDFLGYEVEVLETIDYLDSYHRGYVSYKYGEIDMDDLQAYIAALDESPYFRRTGSMDSSVFQLIYFVYTGPDIQITQMDGTAAWNSNLSVYICKPRGIRSEFYIYEYPGFTVNSEKAVPKPVTVPEGRERCIFCNGGSCKTCGGSGYVYQWIPGEDDQRRVNCTSCMNGRCTVCDGNGWR